MGRSQHEADAALTESKFTTPCDARLGPQDYLAADANAQGHRCCRAVGPARRQANHSSICRGTCPQGVADRQHPDPDYATLDVAQLTAIWRGSYRDRDGSFTGRKRECGERVTCLEPAAAPATVSGELPIRRPLGSRVLGRRRGVVIREPGDLPSDVVTREHADRGELAVD